MRRTAILLLLTLCTVACGERQTATDSAKTAEPKLTWRLAQPRAIEFTRPASVSIPALTAGGDGSILLGWMEELEKKKRYRFMMSRYDGKSWSEPRLVREGDDFFANWADTPKLAESGSGVVFAQWLQRSGSGTYDYAVNIARSSDDGKTWSRPLVPHTTEVNSEFGFVSLVPEQNGVALAWLDGRNMKHEGAGQMTIRYARVSDDGRLSDESVLDDRVCECCQTGMAQAASGPVVVYRDRDEREVRDTGVVRREGAGWSKPALVHKDGWVIPGCPVNGPQVSAAGENVAVAWFTGSENLNRVRAAFSADGGKSFGTPMQVSSSESLGRVGLEMIDSDTAVVTWMEKRGEHALIQARILGRDGAVGEPIIVGTTASARASGFPRIARTGNSLFIAWTIPGETSKIELSEIPLERMN